MKKRNKTRLLLFLALLIFALSISTALGEREALVVSGYPSGSKRQADTLAEFAILFPNVEVVLEKRAKDDQIVTALTNGDSNVDIYYISTEFGLLSRLIEKKYYADLAGVSPLFENTAGFYPLIQKQFQDGTAIAAYPMEMVFGGTFFWQSNYADEMGLTEADIPHTFDELMALVTRWEDENSGIMNDYAVIHSGDYGNPYFGILAQLYKETSLRDTQNIVFDSPVFAEALAQIAHYTQPAPKGLSDEANSRLVSSLPSYMAIFASSETPSGGMLGEANLLPFALALNEQTEPVITVTFLCFIINPYSEHIDEAKAFLSCAASNQSPYALMAMSPALQLPLENPNFENELSEMDQLIAELEQRWAACEPEEQREYRHIVDEAIASREHFVENNRYLVSEKVLKRYQEEIVPHLFAGGNTIYETRLVNQTMNEIYERYLAGGMNETNLVRTLDRTIEMVALENEVK